MNTKAKHLKLMQFTLSALSLGIAFICSAQPAKHVFITPMKFDVYNNLCWEDEKARLDNFALHLKRTPDEIGEIIVFAGELSCEGEAAYRGERAKKWILKRGIKKEQLRVHDGGYREDVETEMWVHSKEAPQVWFETRLTKDQVSIRKRCVEKVFAKVICLNR